LRVHTIDAHCGGAPLRLIVDGFPSPRGRSMREKEQWVGRHADAISQALMLEPRGHGAMCGAVLTEPASPAAHAGILFLMAGGSAPLLGHAVAAVATIALERGLIMPGGDGTSVTFDTVAGTIAARARRSPRPDGGTRVTSVTFSGIPSFVVLPGVPLTIGSRQLRVDVAYGGGFYAIVDSEAAGLPLDTAHFPELGRAGIEIKEAVEARHDITHPTEPVPGGIDATIFTAPPRAAEADLRSVAVFANGQVDRSACGTGMWAIMAVLDAMGLLADDRPFVQESAIGTTFAGRVARRTMVSDHPAIVADAEGSAWITGEHTFVLDDDDPLRNGVVI
jgi:trans-L-3-hydroxyproline dehydratase